MSDDRRWHPNDGAGRGDRGGDDRTWDEQGHDPYSPPRRAGYPPQPEEPAWYRGAPAARDPYEPPPGGRGRTDPAAGYPPRGRGADPRRVPVDAVPGGRRGAEVAADAWLPDVSAGGARSGPPGGTVNRDVDLDEIGPRNRSGRAAGGRGARSARRRKIMKWTAIGVSTTLVLMLGIGAYVVIHLTGNIKHSALLENGMTQSAEPTDPYGRSQMNVLIIGSDTRSTAADCKLGGDCGAGANADVEMVVHVSADRSNATIMSIPRDTEVTLPRCTDPSNNTSGGGFVSTINTSLQWGPACTVQAVHDLTGLTIDHFVMVDFSGVETMSNALGGVQVCVSDKMYDKYSGLRLNAGTNTVQGLSALQFVRTRHGFYDGSDLGREKAQHYFLSAMIREVRANLNLADFATLYKIANAATSALTVDDALSGASNLEGLATTLNKVPTSRITFVTMPWQLSAGNGNRVMVWQPEAQKMFANIKGDVPYTKGSGAAAGPAPGPTASASAPGADPVPSPTVEVNKGAVHVDVLNGSGASGRATAVKGALVNDGFSLAAVGGNATPAAKTALYYPASRADSAATVANSLGLPSSALKESTAYSAITLVVGADWTSGDTFGGSGAPGATAPSGGAPAASAPADSSQLNASATGGCVQVAPNDIIR